MSSAVVTPGPADGASPLQRRVAFLAALVTLAVVATSLMVSAWVHRPVPYARDAPATAAFEDQTGLRLLRVAPSGAGGLVAISYQVLEPSKAADAFGEAQIPLIIDEATGRTLANPLMGHVMGHHAMKEALTYSTVLEDPSHLVRPGGFVTVVVGDVRLEHVVVA